VSREREGAESDFSSGIPATGMERLWSHGKEGVIGSSPIEGFTNFLLISCFCWL
jgi:hypothetical protein